MREKHCELSIFMFTVTTVLLFGFFMLAARQVFAGNMYKIKDHQKEFQKQKEQNTEDRKPRRVIEREDLKHYEKQGRRDDEIRPDYQKYRGYSQRPYDQHRLYVNYDYKGHRYDYHGHWRSWDQWDRYARKHSHIYKHGEYYRQNAHLMFRFCEPDTGNCFYFSIGR
ncbi:MAG: hypothetical protein P8012_13855 [Desulfobacterales bacterium]